MNIREVEKKARSSSLKQTIKTIQIFMEEGVFPKDQSKTKDAEMRQQMYEQVDELCKKFYTKGFKAGHRIAHDNFVSKGYFPKKLKGKMKSSFFVDKDSISIISELKKAKTKRK